MPQSRKQVKRKGASDHATRDRHGSPPYRGKASDALKKAFGLSDAASRTPYEHMKKVIVDSKFDTFFDATTPIKDQLAKVDEFVDLTVRQKAFLFENKPDRADHLRTYIKNRVNNRFYKVPSRAGRSDGEGGAHVESQRDRMDVESDEEVNDDAVELEDDNAGNTAVHRVSVDHNEHNTEDGLGWNIGPREDQLKDAQAVKNFLDIMCYVRMGHLTNAFLRAGLSNIHKIHAACELPTWDRNDILRGLVDDTGTPVSELDVTVLRYGMEHFRTGKRPLPRSYWGATESIFHAGEPDITKPLPEDLHHFLFNVCQPPVPHVKRWMLMLSIKTKRDLQHFADRPIPEQDKFIQGFENDETTAKIHFREMTALSNGFRQYRTVP